MPHGEAPWRSGTQRASPPKINTFTRPPKRIIGLFKKNLNFLTLYPCAPSFLRVWNKFSVSSPRVFVLFFIYFFYASAAHRQDKKTSFCEEKAQLHSNSILPLLCSSLDLALLSPLLSTTDTHWAEGEIRVPDKISSSPVKSDLQMSKSCPVSRGIISAPQRIIINKKYIKWKSIHIPK